MKSKLSFCSILLVVFSLAGSVRAAAPEPAPKRGLIIAVASTAPPEIQRAAASILAAAKVQPLLVAMGEGHPPAGLTDSLTLAAAKPADRGYSHLVVIGLPTDPLIDAAWQREAKMKADDFYIFGFGHLRGDIGYLESDRNPFLHSRWIPTAPYETEIVTVTGSTPAGVALAAQAFVEKGLVNGLIARPGWQRTSPNLLEHDPLAATFAVPGWVPAHLGDWTKIGVMQSSEDEYRGVAQDTGVSPQEIWRIKYYKTGVWDMAGAAAAFENYSAGLHRRAYGDTLWLARFHSAEEAAAAAPKIAHEAKLSRKGGIYLGRQPPYGPDSSNPDEAHGSLGLWQRGDWLVMSTLPRGVAEADNSLVEKH